MPIQCRETDRLTEEFCPVREKLSRARALVFFDLDGTVLNHIYTCTNIAGLKASIARLQRNGVIVGIHSDSPRETVTQFAEMFGVQGPLLYEMAAIHFPEDQIDIALDPKVGELFTSLKNAFGNAARGRFPDTPHTKYLVTDTSDRNQEKRTGTIYPGYRYGIWINPLRRFSFGLWAEGITADGSTTTEANFHQLVDDLLKECIEIEPNATDIREHLEWDFNPEYGVTILRLQTLSRKTQLLMTLLSLTDVSIPTYMIGDSLKDYIEDPRVENLAVANATDPLIEKLQSEPPLPQGFNSRIASSKYADGVIEHLSAIADSLNI